MRDYSAAWEGDDRRHYDVVVVGSGVGGSMAAHAMVGAGLDVLMIERGRPVRRGPHTWSPDAFLVLSEQYTMESHYVARGDTRGRMGTLQCVGGPAVFFGCVAYRMRHVDFEPCPEIVGHTGASWPYGYDELEPYYGWAERILGVAGKPGADPTEPRRAEPYPKQLPDLQGPARLIWDAASRLRLSPSYLPLAIDFGGDGEAESGCVRCGTCDGYACAVGAKRDPSTALIPGLVRRGLTLRPDTVAVRLLSDGGRVAGVVGVDRSTGRRQLFTGRHYVLAAGALATPHLVLASGLEGFSPARDWVGRCLMRHCNAIVYGLFSSPVEGSRAFHKQVGILDHYGGGDGTRKLGSIQSIHPPPPGLLREKAPRTLGRFAEAIADRSTGLVVMAEDEPRRENRVQIDWGDTDRYGLPRAVVSHRHTTRDGRARSDLARIARKVLRTAGAKYTYQHRLTTFSHALGTMRMGTDPETSPLDSTCRVRGVENLWVTDGSALPRSGGVNPSLTIAANALRAAEHIASVAGGRIDASRSPRPHSPEVFAEARP